MHTITVTNIMLSLTFSVWIAMVVWLFLVLLVIAFMPLSESHSKRFDNAPITFYVIFITHTMLPSNRKVSLMLGALAAVVDLSLCLFHSLQSGSATIDNTWKYVRNMYSSLLYIYCTDFSNSK